MPGLYGVKMFWIMVPMPKYGAIAITLSCRNFFGQSQNQIN